MEVRRSLRLEGELLDGLLLGFMQKCVDQGDMMMKVATWRHSLQRKFGATHVEKFPLKTVGSAVDTCGASCRYLPGEGGFTLETLQACNINMILCERLWAHRLQ